MPSIDSRPYVSVIVPNYNHAAYLPRRLESILAQTFTDFELIILDDASTDDSRTVIARYLVDPRVLFYPNETNSGSPFVQWNRGVALARGEFVWIAESDDYAAPSFLEQLLQELRSKPNVGLAYCASSLVDANDRIFGTTESHTADLDAERWRHAYVNDGRDECRRFLLWRCTPPNASAVVFRRDVFLRAGGAPQNLRLCGDWLTWVRMLILSDVAFTSERLNFFRYHDTTVRASVTSRIFFDERWIVQRHLLRSGLVPPEGRRTIATWVANEYLSRVRLAKAGTVCPEILQGWRQFWPILIRAPLTVSQVVLSRAKGKLRHTIRHGLLQALFRSAETASSLRRKLPAASLRPEEILVLTAYTPDLATIGAISADNKARYARKHGYAFLAITSGFPADRPPAWGKILFIREALRTHRLVFWTDADALIMNDAIRLESLIAPGVDVHLTRALTPFPHINTGHMLFRASPFTRLFLAAVWRLEAFTHDSTWEQRAVNHLLENYRFRRVRVSPNRLFNSLGHVPDDPDPYQDGDFIIHFPGLPDKASLIAKYAANPSVSERHL